MRVKPAVCLGLLLVALSSACCAQSAPKLNEILPRVQDHVKEFENSLPDFICDERITSRELMAGTVIHETVIDSTFRVLRAKTGKTSLLPNGARSTRLTDGRCRKASN